ncbi:MAG: OmpH family outer membrane protein [Alphaproteobacteria bacterium]|nr:OmpH family outer membrane protein [Alphaproteobacteria bacterium]MDE2630145.1 OmpH family outer membrane protein [Alphaproteobacteria bacterium]
MTTKMHITYTILMAGLIFLGMAGVDAASAAPPPPGGAPTARILMVDMRRVMAGSKVGQDIQRQVEALKAQAQSELKGEESSLRSEETQLQQQAAILAPDVKARRIKDFQAKAQSFQRKVQERGGLIQGGVIKAQQQIEQALGPILQGIMKERGATVLLDRSSILLAPNSIDVTSLVVQRLDMRMPTVKVELTAPPPGMQQQQQ